MQHIHDSSCTCPECLIGPFSRNNFFTGKLMTAEDFYRDQDYFSGKLRHHHQRLHGSGVVCGLQVVQHPNDDCRDRYVIVRPGTAVDCCGREIVLFEEETIDLTAFELVRELQEEVEGGPHRLQLCIRYRECPTDQVPVLYDDCGCDDAQCAPNAVLESYDFDVIRDGPLPQNTVSSPVLSRLSTTNPPHARRVVQSGDRLYALSDAGDNRRTVFQLEAEGYAVTGVHTLPAAGLEVAVSNDGGRLYVVVEQPSGNATDPLQLVVIDTAAFAGAPVRAVDLPNSSGSPAFLSVIPAPDGRLVVLLGQNGDVLVWPTGLNDPGPDPAPAVIDAGAALSGLAVSGNGQRAYAADAANASVVVVDVPGSTTAPALAVFPAGTAPSGLALVASTAADALAVLSSADRTLHLVEPGASIHLGQVTLAHTPLSLAVSPGGAWAYVLEEEAGQGHVEIVSLNRLRQGLSALEGTPFAVGQAPRAIGISPTGKRIYVAFAGDPELAGSGGLAILEVDDRNCLDLLDRDCPDCTQAYCLVLATFERYRYGFRLFDPADPATDPDSDFADRITRIDNRLGRKRLPSVEALAEAIECLLALEPGGAGTQGPPGLPGPPGDPGPGIDRVDIEWIPCDQDPEPPRIEVVDGVGRVLILQIPNGCQDLEIVNEVAKCGEQPSASIDTTGGGRTLVLRWPPPLTDLQVDVNPVSCGSQPGGQVMQDQESGACRLELNIPTGCQEGLAHICGINWPHNGVLGFNEIGKARLDHEGLVVLFDAPVMAETLTDDTFQVLLRMPEASPNMPYDIGCYCRLRGRVAGIQFDPSTVFEDCYKRFENMPPPDTDVRTGLVWGARFVPVDRNGKVVPNWILGEFQVILEGDFILGNTEILLDNGKKARLALDAEHLGPGLPWPAWIPGPYPPDVQILGFRAPTGDGTQGGRFVSWFNLTDVRIDLNRASEEELKSVSGIGQSLARNIIKYRQEQRISRVEDLQAIRGLTSAALVRIRTQVSFGPEEG